MFATRHVLLSTIVVTLALGCSSTDSGDGPSSSVDAAAADQADDLADYVDVGDAKEPRAYDRFLVDAVIDNEQWWATEFPEVYGEPYIDLDDRIYAGYPERTTTIPGCSGASDTSYDQLASYVAFYCSDADFLAYDDGATSGLAALAEQHGPEVVGVVISHEWAHAIQKRAGVFAERVATVHTEQHADCVAGAWVARAYRGESDRVNFDDTGVSATLAAIAEVRDPIGSSQFDQDGHGSAFDRLGAFQVGFDEGVARCAELIQSPLPLTQNEFMPNTGDAEREGNAPYSCDVSQGSDCSAAPDFITGDLQAYWSEQIDGFPTVELSTNDPSTNPGECVTSVELSDLASVCDEPSLITIDDDRARQVHEEIGDFAFGYLLATGYAEVALSRSQVDLTGAGRALARDCLTGRWIADITPDGSGQTRRNAAILSPGDLDEVVELILEIGDSGGADNRLGTPINKISALRSGLYGNDCERYLPSDPASVTTN